MASRPPDPPADLGEDGLRFWMAWSEAPQALVFTDAEWERLADTARLFDEGLNTDDGMRRLEISRELRQRMDEFGWVSPAFLMATER